MDKREILKKLVVDDNAISFIRANEKEYEAQYNMFVKLNTPYVIGIDLSNSKDSTGYMNAMVTDNTNMIVKPLINNL